MLAGVVGAVGSGDAHRNEAELEGGSVVADSVGGQFVHGEGWPARSFVPVTS